MPRKKKVPLTGVGLNPDSQLIVQKSRPLEALWKSDLTLPEFKLLDLYLARINSHDPQKCLVTLSKGEIESALGVTKISAENLADRLLHLGQGIKIPDSTKAKGFRIMWLLDEAQCEIDENDQWRVTLSASPKAMKYFFNCDNLGYFRYKLRAVKDMTSRYTYVLFLYLEKHRHMGLQWDIALQELREMLSCTSERYEQFKFFNSEILKRCQKEIHEKTECRFTYEPIRKGRKVATIRFTLEPLKDLLPPAGEEDPNQLHWDDLTVADPDDRIGFYADAAPDLSRPELEQIVALLVAVPDYKLPHMADGGIEIWRWHYLQARYKTMMAADARKPIQHKANYLAAMIQKDMA